ncbi:hypothetical protein KUTeg_002088 [Tegillarca granosa]|uniref:Uncharacterized protein n=1 Tax=Tegillarca granosa TaxID=220873 RepID=A0ABQ9FWH8_TEGGR|nr:hypothetical protein KUTeg_002088 [Tegillarca granosa]
MTRFIPNYKGWNKACKADLPLPRLPEPLVCHIPESCTEVDCCLEVDKIFKTFNPYIKLDACNYKLHVGIDKYNIEVLLFDYDWVFICFNLKFQLKKVSFLKKMIFFIIIPMFFAFCLFVIENVQLIRFVEFYFSGEVKTINLGQLIYISYKIENLEKDKKYIVNMNNFSLVDWYNSKKITPGSLLSGVTLAEVLEHFGLNGYLLSTPCNRNQAPYTGAVNGWKNDSKCTRVDCCVDVGFLGKSFHGFIHLDPCNFRLSVGVEKLSIPGVSVKNSSLRIRLQTFFEWYF